jgi:hypothetical protein
LAQYEFKNPDLLTDEEVSDILSRVDLFTKWANSVEEHALAAALNGKTWPGFKLVEGRANRIYKDATEVTSTLLKAGFTTEAIYKPQELLGITALKGAIGAPAFRDHVEDLLIKPKGKPTLVPASDKRPAYNSLEGAAADFDAPLETE